MDRRTYESPMDWEYQGSGPMDPSSPFVQSVQQSNQNQGHSFSSSSFSTFGRTHSTPSKPASGVPPQTPTGYSGSFLQRTTTAPPFRNPAFTTPRKPFEIDALSEVSAAESSPAAATDVSDALDTPDHDQSYDIGQMTITPASMSRNKSLSFGKKMSGKGEIARSIFAGRDRVRKRKRFNNDRDVSGYRLPYRYQDEWDETDYDSDESTGDPSQQHDTSKRRTQTKGWFGNFLAQIQQHPTAPQVLGYWISLFFHLASVGFTLFILWMIWAGLREDFYTARRAATDTILNEMDKCRANFVTNKCAPKEQRLPAVYQMCEQWFECFNQDPSAVRNVQIGAKGIVEILNEIVEAMHWKTMILFVVVLALFFFSSKSVVKSATGYAEISSVPPPTPYPSHSHHMMHPSSGIAWEQIPQQTPRRMKTRPLMGYDETPETDGSPPPRYGNALMAPETPRRSPSKGERGRSPAKSRSPIKRY